MKFEDVIKEHLSKLDEADPGMDPNLGGAPVPPPGGDPSAGDPSAEQLPELPEEPKAEPEVKPLTTEGRRFLVDLALKALAFNPDSLTAADKALFDSEVTTENAEEVLERVQHILDASGVASSSPVDQG